MKPRSPIEMMVDAACGFDPEANAPVVLYCPSCGRSKPTYLDKSDPEGTVRIESPCPDCKASTGDLPPVYLGADGREIN